MKILHLSTSASGGAGRAARRLNGALVQSGQDSRIIFLGKNETQTLSHEISIMRSAAERLTSSGITFLQNRIVQSGSDPITFLTMDAISISEIIKYKPEVVHIHNFYNLLSVKSIINLSTQVKVVITLHDQRIFTAGCHYSHSCDGYRNSCEKCPQMRPFFRNTASNLFKSNMELLQISPETLHLVSPSKWLLEKAKENKHFIDINGTVIKNPIPEMPICRVRPFKDDRLHIGFCSDLLSNPLKGLEILLSAAKMLDRPYVIHLIGRKLDENECLTKVNYLVHSPKSESDLRNLISNLDVLVVPSTEDNSPNVIGEALMSGVKVIGSQTGGITEIMNELKLDSFNPTKPQELKKILEEFNFSYSRDDISCRAREVFSYDVVSRQMMNFYNE